MRLIEIGFVPGERHDGHTYINDLYQKGVRNFVVSQLPKNYTQLTDAVFILVSGFNIIAALLLLMVKNEIYSGHEKTIRIPLEKK